MVLNVLVAFVSIGFLHTKAQIVCMPDLPGTALDSTTEPNSEMSYQYGPVALRYRYAALNTSVCTHIPTYPSVLTQLVKIASRDSHGIVIGDVMGDTVGAHKTAILQGLVHQYELRETSLCNGTVKPIRINPFYVFDSNITIKASYSLPLVKNRYVSFSPDFDCTIGSPGDLSVCATQGSAVPVPETIYYVDNLNMCYFTLQTTSVTTALQTTSFTTPLQTTSVTTALQTTSFTTPLQTTSFTTPLQTTSVTTTSVVTETLILPESPTSTLLDFTQSTSLTIDSVSVDIVTSYTPEDLSYTSEDMYLTTSDNEVTDVLTVEPPLAKATRNLPVYVGICVQIILLLISN
ncbi:hypothetical protein [Ranid herpesvirus 3]|uniref:Uncharacterized protein n=1 Tax=Ranid herpesvirus 3 TaxID=1987509 RepID=A0A1X9T5E4_9VIRU|nr:hypothetical protein [Ranid herpesvirus 3]ARR28920.1 hypothetical protein [Ranid herpesvirus 3]